MLLDGLQLLASAGFPIRQYRYLGMGAFYFVDYVLFHKFLGIDDLVSFEHEVTIRRRVQFNRPFACVRLRFEPIGEYFEKLTQRLPHIAWIDYDSVLAEVHLRDVVLAASRLAVGSVLLVTVDCEPPDGRNASPKRTHAYYTAEAGAYLRPGLRHSDFAAARLPELVASTVENAIGHGVHGRDGLAFEPLFRFEYADGHRMMTCGGMIVDNVAKRRLKASQFGAAVYSRLGRSGMFRIHVPKLTQRERLYLEARMPATSGWRPAGFELGELDTEAYRGIYRFFPTYAELFL